MNKLCTSDKMGSLGEKLTFHLSLGFWSISKKHREWSYIVLQFCELGRFPEKENNENYFKYVSVLTLTKNNHFLIFCHNIF